MEQETKKLFIKRTKDLLKIWPIFVLYLVLYITGIGCPIKFITGLSCPGCGFTRSILAIFSLNIKDAFVYHPCFILFPISFVLLYYFKEKRVCKIIGWCLVGIILIVYVYRLFDPNNSIVYFDFSESILYLLFKRVL